MLIRANVLKNTSIKDFNGFNFEELCNMSNINLRGDSTDKNFITSVKNILGSLLPIESNISIDNDKLKIIWLSPSEWLIQIYTIQDFEKILSDLNKTLNSENTSVTDVTENRTILKLSGTNLYKLLSKFMIIDLDKAMCKEKSVAQTIFIKAPVLITRNHKKNEKQSINLHTNRSHAQYIVNLLIDGSKNINF